jgi:hypothetical protein
MRDEVSKRKTRLPLLALAMAAVVVASGLTSRVVAAAAAVG